MRCSSSRAARCRSVPLLPCRLHACHVTRHACHVTSIGGYLIVMWVQVYVVLPEGVKPIAALKKGAFFGEMAMLSKVRCNGSCNRRVTAHVAARGPFM
jgi:hypothetical protein